MMTARSRSACLYERLSHSRLFELTWFFLRFLLDGFPQMSPILGPFRPDVIFYLIRTKPYRGRRCQRLFSGSRLQLSVAAAEGHAFVWLFMGGLISWIYLCQETDRLANFIDLLLIYTDYRCVLGQCSGSAVGIG